MNRMLSVALLLSIWIVSVPVHGQALDGRIVFVNLDEVFNEFYKTKLADAQLKEQAEEFSEERGKLVEEYEGLNERFTAAREAAQDVALSEDARNRQRNEAEELLIEIRDFEARIQRFDTTRRQQLEEQGRRMRTRIVSEIQEEIRRYARSQGFHAVIDSSGQSLNAVEMVLYVDSRIDITAAILDILNKGR